MKLKSPEFRFVIIAFLFGIIIMFITPQFQVSDEPAHFERAKEVSKGIIYNNLPQNRKDNYQYHGASGYSPVMYLSSALGYKFGCITNNYQISFYSGRFFNLLVWIFLIFLAIKITPVFKWQFFFVALLPISIFQGMSYSADSFNNAFTFLFFAYVFKLIFENKDITLKKDLPLIAGLSLTGAMCKCAIYPLFLLLSANIKKQKKYIVLLIIIFSILLSYLWSSNNYINILYEADYKYNKYILTHNPLFFVHKFFLSFIYYWPEWSKQIIGKLGAMLIKFNDIFYPITFLLLFLSFFYIPEKYKIKFSHRIFSIFIFIGYIFFSCLLLFLSWTPADSYYIQGIQGRYFLAVMPLVFIVFAPNLANIKPEAEEIFKIVLILYILFMLSYTVVVITNYYYHT